MSDVTRWGHDMIAFIEGKHPGDASAQKLIADGKAILAGGAAVIPDVPALVAEITKLALDITKDSVDLAAHSPNVADAIATFTDARALLETVCAAVKKAKDAAQSVMVTVPVAVVTIVPQDVSFGKPAAGS